MCSPLSACANINYATNAAVGKFGFPFSDLISIARGQIFHHSCLFTQAEPNNSRIRMYGCFACVTGGYDRVTSWFNEEELRAAIHVIYLNDGVVRAPLWYVSNVPQMLRLSRLSGRAKSVFVVEISAFYGRRSVETLLAERIIHQPERRHDRASVSGVLGYSQVLCRFHVWPELAAMPHFSQTLLHLELSLCWSCRLRQA